MRPIHFAIAFVVLLLGALLAIVGSQEPEPPHPIPPATTTMPRHHL